MDFGYHFTASHRLFIAAFVIAQGWNDSLVRNKRRRGLTLEVAGDVILNLVVAWRAEKQGPVHQGKLLKHRQGSVAQRTVDHVPLAGAESWQDKPAGEEASAVTSTTSTSPSSKLAGFFFVFSLPRRRQNAKYPREQTHSWRRPDVFFHGCQSLISVAADNS